MALLCDSLRATRLSDLFPGIVRAETLEPLVDDLCGVLDKRSQTIFLGRISLNHLRTLEDLGTEIGVTKERVRQLSLLAEERIREALGTPRFAPIVWRARTRCGLGSGRRSLATPLNSTKYLSTLPAARRRREGSASSISCCGWPGRTRGTPRPDGFRPRKCPAPRLSTPSQTSAAAWI
jgi:hypothetical protein